MTISRVLLTIGSIAALTPVFADNSGWADIEELWISPQYEEVVVMKLAGKGDYYYFFLDEQKNTLGKHMLSLLEIAYVNRSKIYLVHDGAKTNVTVQGIGNIGMYKARNIRVRYDK